MATTAFRYSLAKRSRVWFDSHAFVWLLENGRPRRIRRKPSVWYESSTFPLDGSLGLNEKTFEYGPVERLKALRLATNVRKAFVNPTRQAAKHQHGATLPPACR